MLETTHLPRGYPLTSGPPSYQACWHRAFEIHNRDCRNPLSRAGIINPVQSAEEPDETYCDCYERAWCELRPDEVKRFRTISIDTTGRIR